MKSSDETLNIIMFVSVAILVYSFATSKGPSLTGSIGISDRWSPVLSWKHRPLIKDTLEGFAFAIEQDGLRPEDERYTPDRDGAFEDLFNILHYELGPKSPKLKETNPKLADFMVNEIGDIPEFPEGRAVLVEKLRAIAEEL